MSAPRQYRNKLEGADIALNLHPIDVSSVDWIAPGAPTNGLWCGAAGKIRVLMTGAQYDGVKGVTQPAKRGPEDDDGVDHVGPPVLKTRAVTVPVTAGFNKLSVVRVYVTGTDGALNTAGIYAVDNG